MQSNGLFRVTRGVAMVIAIVVAHFVIVWLFQHMKIPAPQFGPVDATILVEQSPDNSGAPQDQGPTPASSTPRSP